MTPKDFLRGARSLKAVFDVNILRSVNKGDYERARAFTGIGPAVFEVLSAAEKLDSAYKALTEEEQKIVEEVFKARPRKVAKKAPAKPEKNEGKPKTKRRRRKTGAKKSAAKTVKTKVSKTESDTNRAMVYAAMQKGCKTNDEIMEYIKKTYPGAKISMPQINGFRVRKKES